MNLSFDNRTVLVTGAASGIGRAIALAAGRSGARLIVGDVAAAGLAETVSLLEGNGAAVISAICDVSKQTELDVLFAKGAAMFGHPDIVYANAGILGSPVDVWDCAEADFARVIDVNLMGAFRTFKAALPGMVNRGSGVIVATASVAGLIGAPGLAAYVASKHAVIGLVKSTALNVADKGIRVNALCPGMVDTAMLDALAAGQPGLREALMVMNPMKRLATPDDIANAAIWLASDQSSFVTGHCLAVDGGFIAQ
ncbi:glucose 1-dehydrogenase [Nevskia sp.]|uniref:SDR family NAD(P)-dependent oxidoreductase n=1 Tax=Nevskia sp. TaxID=1929292 RepID=UPI0025D8EB8F|nr:glucose 1-dehydrogenase [Nevskia sp.]